MNVIEDLDAARALAMRIRPAVGGFPYLAEVMRRAGVKRYLFDVASASVIYSTDDGDALYPGALLRDAPTIVPPFDEAALITALREDQEGRSTFPAFVEASLVAGVVRYEVDTAARTCSYFGVRGEVYVEEYAAVELESLG